MILPLAAGGGDYLFLVVMLVFGLINWLAGKMKEAKEAKAPPPPLTGTARTLRSETEPQSGDPEAERMRRFMEALGIPQDEEPAPPPPPVRRPAPVFPAAPVAPPPLPLSDYSLDEAHAPTAPAADIYIPEVRTSFLEEYHTVSSRVSADADAAYATVTGETSAIPGVARVAEVPEHLRDFGLGVGTVHAALSSRANIRTALVLREILGPPRSLQA